MGQGDDNEYSVEKLLTVIGQLYVLPRREKVKLLEWLIANFHKFDGDALGKHYGVLLLLLRSPSLPVKLLSRFIVMITEERCITQSRVNLVTDMFIERNNSPSLGRLLQVMREKSHPRIYFPPLGQGDVRHAQLPLNLITKMRQASNTTSEAMPPEACDLEACSMATDMYVKLLRARKSTDIMFSSALAQLVPLIEQTSRVPLAVEKVVYEYLEGEWQQKFNASATLALKIILGLFRFWPTNNLVVTQERLLSPLFRAQASAAELIIPHLWYFGYYAAPVMVVLTGKLKPVKHRDWQSSTVITRYIHIYQFYKLTGAGVVPPEDAVSSLVIQQFGYLSLCAQWAHAVPKICRTLQGRFGLATGVSDTVLSAFFPTTQDDSVAIRFDIVNVAWLGGYPQRTYSRLKVLRGSGDMELLSTRKPQMSVTIINAANLRRLGMTRSEFCSQLLEDLEETGLCVYPYLNTFPDTTFAINDPRSDAPPGLSRESSATSLTVSCVSESVSASVPRIKSDHVEHAPATRRRGDGRPDAKRLP